jgi:DNA-binding CsgD family transcriptional regulator
MPHRSGSASQARTVAQIRQLCCLGLGREASAPALVRLLLRLVPAHSASLFFTDENGVLINIYDEDPAVAEFGPRYMREFYNGRESEVAITITEAFQRGLVRTTLEQLRKVDRRTWERSALYNEILRPLGHASGIQVMVRESGRALGAVVISRGPAEPELSTRELELLATLEPYFAHAFAGVRSEGPLVDSDADEDQGFLIVDRKGRLRHLSPQARALLFYAFHDDVEQANAQAAPDLPPRVARLACTLARVFEGEAASAPPVHVQDSRWGQFVFRAHWLDGVEAEPPLVCIRIARREPLALRLLRRVDRLPLSGRQIEVAVHLAAGLTYAAIAERMGVSTPTAVYHAQELFNKLGVGSRAQLQAWLMEL